MPADFFQPMCNFDASQLSDEIPGGSKTRQQIGQTGSEFVLFGRKSTGYR